MKYLVPFSLLVGLTGSVMASEGTEPNVLGGKAGDLHPIVGMETDCCWDKVDFDRPVVPTQSVQGPDCCWVKVWGETSQ